MSFRRDSQDGVQLLPAGYDTSTVVVDSRRSSREQYAPVPIVGDSWDDPLLKPMDATETTVVFEETSEGTTATQTTFNTINLLVGVGILATPFAFKAGGLVITTALMAVLSFMSWYTARLIKLCLDSDPSNLKSYPDLAYATFGHIGRIFISSVFCCEIFTACVMYIVLLGDNLHSLTPHFSRRTYMLMSLAVFLPQALTKNLGWLAYLSVLGVFTTFVLFVSIIATGISDGLLLHPSKSIGLYDLETAPMAIGLVMVGLAGHACFPSMYNSMKNKGSYDAVMGVTYTIVSLLYFVMGLCGYLMYGEGTAKEVTLNLKGTIAGSIATAVVVVNPLAKFGLTVNPVACVLEDALGISTSTTCFAANQSPIHRLKYPMTLALRTIMTCAAITIAIFVPHFDKILALCGSAFSFTMSIIFPVACYVVLFWSRLSWISIAFHLVIVLVGIAFAGLGTYAAIVFKSGG